MYKKILIFIILTMCINIYPLFARDYEETKSTDSRIESPNEINNESNQPRILPSSLDRLYKLYAENKEYMQIAKGSDIEIIEDRVVVAILTKPGITTRDIDENDLKSFGVRIQAKAKHSISVEIPISELVNVATAVKESAEIRLPLKPVPDVTSEGVILMNADEWLAAGDSGTGVKVAVIDLGFDSLTEAQNAGDMPPSPVSYDFTGGGLQTTTPHGTAVAEAIFDLVPKADFYLYKIANQTHFENAVDSCISNGVDIINHSCGWFNALGYYDGTGLICAIADTALIHSILWVNSAGNYARQHYRSVFSGNASGYHLFAGTDTINPTGPYAAGMPVTIKMNWDEYPTTDQDYDLYLARDTGAVTPKWVIVASSTDRQDGAGPSLTDYPEESITFDNPGGGTYGILVKKYSATTNVDFTLFSLYGNIDHYTSSSSLPDPGTVDSVITVGAIGRTVYNTTGAIEYFSSQGPTNDGRIKPDVAAPDGCSSFTYRNQAGGYWYGTSLSSPHTAGVCALIKSRHPGYTNSIFRDYLYTNCTVDLGTSGKDNVYGHGKVVMPDVAITVTSPNGGEIWQVGSSHGINWTSSGTSGGVRIEYSTNNGSSWTEETASTPDNGTYSWTIPDAPSSNCLVRITDTIGIPSDTSNAVFRIFYNPFITVGSPNGGEDWQVGSSYDITWISGGTSGNVRIEYSADRGWSWSDVIASMPDTGVYPWVIPDTPSDTCLVRITDTDGSPSDTSDAVFTISSIPSITVGSPNGGEDWQVDSTYDITWTSINTSGGVQIEYSTDSGSSWLDVIASMPDTGAYPWVIPDTPSDSCLVRITDTATGGPSDTSDAIFTISSIPFITVSSPNGGEIWEVGSDHDITWTSINTSGGVRIEYSIDSGSSWLDVITSMPDTGAYPWVIPDTPSDSCLVRISDTASGGPSDTSDALFEISPASYITVSSPNGGEDWQVGSSHDITWTTNLTMGGVKIEYSADNGSSWSEIIAGIPADTLAYSWTIPNTPSDSCLLRITDTSSGGPSDTSDAIFTISPATAVPISELPEVYSFYVNRITGSNQFEIRYALPEKAEFILEVYDIKGTKIKELSEENNAGFYSRKIDMSGEPSGVYFIRMEANKKFSKTSKVVLLK
jgi:hypothetical protein